MCRSVERSPACGRKQRAWRCIHTGGWEVHTQTRSVHRPSSFHTLPDTFVAMKTLPLWSKTVLKFSLYWTSQHLPVKSDSVTTQHTSWQQTRSFVSTLLICRPYKPAKKAEKDSKRNQSVCRRSEGRPEEPLAYGTLYRQEGILYRERFKSQQLALPREGGRTAAAAAAGAAQIYLPSSSRLHHFSVLCPPDCIRPSRTARRTARPQCITRTGPHVHPLSRLNNSGTLKNHIKLTQIGI